MQVMQVDMKRGLKSFLPVVLVRQAGLVFQKFSDFRTQTSLGFTEKTSGGVGEDTLRMVKLR